MYPTPARTARDVLLSCGSCAAGIAAKTTPAARSTTTRAHASNSPASTPPTYPALTRSVYADGVSVCVLDRRGSSIGGMDLLAVALAVLAFAVLYGLIELVDRI